VWPRTWRKTLPDRRGQGGHTFPRHFVDLLLLHLHHLLVILRVPPHSKKMSTPNTNFVLRLRSFRWYGPPLAPNSCTSAQKGPAFRIQACAQAQSANRFTPTCPPPLQRSPSLPTSTLTTKTKVEQRVTQKYQTHNIWLLPLVPGYPFMPLECTEKTLYRQLDFEFIYFLIEKIKNTFH